jgi:fucose permease
MELQHVESRKKSVDFSVQPARDPNSSQTRSRDSDTQRKHDSDREQTLDERNNNQGTPSSVKQRNEKLLSRLQFLTLCWTLFIIGWNDSSTGPLIPRLREFYGVRNPV